MFDFGFIEKHNNFDKFAERDKILRENKQK